MNEIVTGKKIKYEEVHVCVMTGGEIERNEEVEIVENKYIKRG